MAAGDSVETVRVRTFLIADVRGYTRFTVEHGDEAGAHLAARFAALMEKVAADAGGELLELRGDEALLTFASARQALRAGVAAQAASAGEAGIDSRLRLPIGIGIDAGEAVPLLGGFRGRALNLAARLCNLAGAGEVLVSETVAHLAGHLDQLEFESRGEVQLKGFSEPVSVVSVRAAAVANSTVEPEIDSAQAAGPEPIPQQLPLGAFLGALPSTPLIGRDGEAAVVAAAVAQVARGEGRALMLTGEPGAGKTRLAQEAFLEARNHGFLLAVGACLDSRQSVPYYPFLDVLPGLVAAAPGLGLANPAGRWPQLQRLLGGAVDEPEMAGGEAENERLRRELTAFLLALAQVQPLALFLDDLHWADNSTLELMHHLIRHSRTHRVLLVGTYRDVEVGRQHPLERVLRDLRRGDLTESVGVRRLGPPATAAMMAAAFGEEQVSEEFAELVHRQTEGNPFFIQQLLRALVERGDVYLKDGRWERREVEEMDLPESIRSTIGERVSRLPAQAQEVLAVASVLGQPFTFRDLQAMSGQAEDDLEEALQQAAARGLIRSEDASEYSFDHTLTQQTLLAEIPGRRRRRWHAAAAAALAAGEAPEARAAEIAHHFAEGEDRVQAARWSLVAGAQAARVYAYPEAERHFREAAELAAEISDADLEAEAMSGLGRALAARGRFAEAAECLSRSARHHARSGRLDAAAALTGELGRIHRDKGTAEAGIVVLEDFLRGAPELAGEGLGQVLVALAQLYWVTGRFDDMIGPAERGSALAEAAGNRTLRAQADIIRAQALVHAGDLAGNRDLLAAAVEGGEALSLTVRAALTNNLAFAHFMLGDFRQNLQFRLRALELTELFAQPANICFARAMVAQAHFYLGSVGSAQSFLESAREAAAGLEFNRQLAYLDTQAAEVSLLRGELERTGELLDPVEKMLEQTGEFQLESWAARVRAELLLRQGRAGEAASYLLPRIEAARGTQVRLSWLLPVWALALIESDRVAEGLAAALESVEIARRETDRWALMEGLRAAGRGLWRTGSFEESEAALAESLALTTAAPHPLGSARTHFERAASLAARGEHGVALASARLAAEGFRALGARPLLEEVLQVFPAAANSDHHR